MQCPKHIIGSPMKLYRSDYPNQVHQLSVSVSKHIYVSAAGRLRFQKKPLEVDLTGIGSSDRVHVVNYLIRDHFSGAFYGEVSSSRELEPVEQFLRRAWSVKAHYLFCGVPHHLLIPKTVGAAFHTIYDFVSSLGVEAHEPTSGFQAGVRDVRTWEESIGWSVKIADEEWSTLERAQSKTLELVIDLNGEASSWTSKIGRWLSPTTPVRDPSGKQYKIDFDDEEGARLICSE